MTASDDERNNNRCSVVVITPEPITELIKVTPWMVEHWYAECPKCLCVIDLGEDVVITEDDEAECDNCQIQLLIVRPAP